MKRKAAKVALFQLTVNSRVSNLKRKCFLANQKTRKKTEADQKNKSKTKKKNNILKNARSKVKLSENGDERGHSDDKSDTVVEKRKLRNSTKKESFAKENVELSAAEEKGITSLEDDEYCRPSKKLKKDERHTSTRIVSSGVGSTHRRLLLRVPDICKQKNFSAYLRKRRLWNPRIRIESKQRQRIQTETEANGKSEAPEAAKREQKSCLRSGRELRSSSVETEIVKQRSQAIGEHNNDGSKAVPVETEVVRRRSQATGEHGSKAVPDLTDKVLRRLGQSTAEMKIKLPSVIVNRVDENHPKDGVPEGSSVDRTDTYTKSQNDSYQVLDVRNRKETARHSTRSSKPRHGTLAKFGKVKNCTSVAQKRRVCNTGEKRSHEETHIISDESDSNDVICLSPSNYHPCSNRLNGQRLRSVASGEEARRSDLSVSSTHLSHGNSSPEFNLPVSGDMAAFDIINIVKNLQESFAKMKMKYEQELHEKDKIIKHLREEPNLQLMRLKNELEWKNQQIEELGRAAERSVEIEAKIGHLLSSREAYEDELRKLADMDKSPLSSDNCDFKSEVEGDIDEAKCDGSKKRKRKNGNDDATSGECDNEADDIEELLIGLQETPNDQLFTLDSFAFVSQDHESPSDVPEVKPATVQCPQFQTMEERDKKVKEAVRCETAMRKGRHDIRRLVSHLRKETKTAAILEADRRERVKKERMKHLINEETDDATGQILCTRMVLAFRDDDEQIPLVEVDKYLLKQLKPHQVEAVEFMWDCVVESVERLKQEKEEGSLLEAGGGCILAHCMGLGKTLSVITFVQTLWTSDIGFKRFLTVSPMNAVLNWVSEWEKWVPPETRMPVYNMSASASHNSRAEILGKWFRDGGLLVVSYSLFRILMSYRGRSKRLKAVFDESLVDPGPDVIICDEGHVLKNNSSAISKCLNRIATRRRIALTGTPLQNNLAEYHCMVNFVRPNLLGTRQEFSNRFVNPITNGQHLDSTSRDVQLMKRRAYVLHQMLSGCIHRRDYSALTKFLPPKNEYVVSVRLSCLQIDLYEKYLEMVRGSAIAKKVNGAVFFSDYQNFMRIWTHPWLLRMEQIRQEQKPLSFSDDDELESLIYTSSSSSSSSSSEEETDESKSGEDVMETDAEDKMEEENENDGEDEVTPGTMENKQEDEKDGEITTANVLEDSLGYIENFAAVVENVLLMCEDDEEDEEDEQKEANTVNSILLTSELNKEHKNWERKPIETSGRQMEEDSKKLKFADDEFVDDVQSNSLTGKGDSFSDSSTIGQDSISVHGKKEPEEEIEKSSCPMPPSSLSAETNNEKSNLKHVRVPQVFAGEVIRNWQTRTRSKGPVQEPDTDVIRPVSTWWSPLLNDDDHLRLELSGKLFLLFEILKMAEDIGEKVLVFSQSLLTLDLIEDFLKLKSEEAALGSTEIQPDQSVDQLQRSLWLKDEDYLRMDGSTGAFTRKRLTTCFNDGTNKRLRLFLISTRAGGLGINLEAANRVVMFDASWNPSHDIQSIFRVYRFGQTRPVFIYRLLAQGTMEEKIYDRQVIKETLSYRVLDEQQINRHFTAADLSELYVFKPDRLDQSGSTTRPLPPVPKDFILAELLSNHRDWIVNYHNHDSLLEWQPEENLSEEERKSAWEEYEKEKQGFLYNAVGYNFGDTTAKAMSAASPATSDHATAPITGIHQGSGASATFTLTRPNCPPVTIVTGIPAKKTNDVKFRSDMTGFDDSIFRCDGVNTAASAVNSAVAGVGYRHRNSMSSNTTFTLTRPNRSPVTIVAGITPKKTSPVKANIARFTNDIVGLVTSQIPMSVKSKLNFQMSHLPRVIEEIIKYNPEITVENLQRRINAFVGIHGT